MKTIPETLITRGELGAILRCGMFVAAVDWNPTLICNPSIVFYRLYEDGERVRTGSIAQMDSEPDRLIAAAQDSLERMEQSRLAFTHVP